MLLLIDKKISLKLLELSDIKSSELDINLDDIIVLYVLVNKKINNKHNKLGIITLNSLLLKFNDSLY